MFRQTTKSARLQVEQLESRELLTANVAVKVTDTNLLIKAESTAKAESIIVRQIANDRFTVEGLNGTTINGGTKKTFSGVSGDVKIFTYGGADTIQVLGKDSTTKMRISGELIIGSGSGSDKITVKNAEVAGDVDIDTSYGRDITKLRNVIAGDDIIVEDYSDFTTGDYDKVYVEYCVAGQSTDHGTLKFDLNDGNDRVYVNRVTMDRLNALLYAGDDYFSMVNSKVRNLADSTIDGGDGSDGVNLYNNKHLVYFPGGSGINGFWGWDAGDPPTTATKAPTHYDEQLFI